MRYLLFWCDKNTVQCQLHKNGNVLIAFCDSKIEGKIEMNKLKVGIRIKTNFQAFYSGNEEVKSKIQRKYMKNNKTNKGILSSL